MTVYYDSETWPIQPGLQAPPVAACQFSTREGEAEIALAPEGLRRLADVLESGETIAGHNIAFDALASSASRPDLLPLWIEAYERDRVACTLVREKLIRIGQGRHAGARYDLVSCLDRHKIDHGFRSGDKGGPASWRTRYRELAHVPPDRWPEDARRYAEEDVRHGLRLGWSQDDRAEFLADEFRQTRADLVLSAIAAHGFRVDQRYVAAFADRVEGERQALRERLAGSGLVRRDGSRNTRLAAARMRAACRAQGLPTPLTDTGKEKLSGELLSRAEAEAQYTALTADDCEATGDSILIDYARFGSIKTLRKRAQRLALAGDLPIQTRFDSLKETGRTSSSMGKQKPGEPATSWGDQIQNMNRAPGLRECYRARPGFLLLSVDWSAAELSTLAEACRHLVGYSVLGDTIRSGLDPHLAFAASWRGWSYEWAAEARKGLHGEEAAKAVGEARQGSKAANFGFPGGLGITKFRLYSASTYGVKLTDQQARDLKSNWLAKYPEMSEYFRIVSAAVDAGHPVVQIGSGRVRGRVWFTNACNSYFQGLAADMAKDAGWRLFRECYLPGTVLFGCRIVNFVHDEYILEVPVDTAHECAERVVRIMEEAGERWAPSAPPKAEPALSYRWRKGAAPVYSGGRLIPWEDRPMPEKHRAEILTTRETEIELSWRLGYECSRIRQIRPVYPNV